MYEIKNSKEVNLSDRIRFRCMRCAECCRHVEATIMIEVKDAFYIAKHLGITVAEFYDQYTEMFLLEDTGFPIFAIRTIGKEKNCIFLKGKHCSIQTVKPRTCRLYPFWVFPEDDGTFVYNYSTERRHHPKGTLIRVKDWMKDFLSDEDKEYLLEEARSIKQIAVPYKILCATLRDQENILAKVLMYRYFMYDTSEPFMQQFYRNNRVLQDDLERIIKKFTSV